MKPRAKNAALKRGGPTNSAVIEGIAVSFSNCLRASGLSRLTAASAMLLVTGSGTLASSPAQASPRASLNDPQIKAVRAVFSEVKRGVEAGDLEWKKVEFVDCGSYEQTRTKYVDGTGVVRLLKRAGGSDDSMMAASVTYDRQGRPRFLFVTGGAVNGTHAELRVYLDRRGREIRRQARLVSGPGYTFSLASFGEPMLIKKPEVFFEQSVQGCGRSSSRSDPTDSPDPAGLGNESLRIGRVPVAASGTLSFDLFVESCTTVKPIPARLSPTNDRECPIRVYWSAGGKPLTSQPLRWGTIATATATVRIIASEVEPSWMLYNDRTETEVSISWERLTLADDVFALLVHYQANWGEKWHTNAELFTATGKQLSSAWRHDINAEFWLDRVRVSEGTVLVPTFVRDGSIDGSDEDSWKAEAWLWDSSRKGLRSDLVNIVTMDLHAVVASVYESSTAAYRGKQSSPSYPACGEISQQYLVLRSNRFAGAQSAPYLLTTLSVDRQAAETILARSRMCQPGFPGKIETLRLRDSRKTSPAPSP